MDKHIRNLLVLKEFFKATLGNNYPLEIVYLIIKASFKPIKIFTGSKCTVISGEKLFIYGRRSDSLRDKINKYISSELEMICFGKYFSIILTTDGKIYSFGINRKGQLGLGDIDDRVIPTESKLNSIKTIYCGKLHTIALTQSSEIYSWGCNDYGQLGLGTNYGVSSPTKILLQNVDFIMCALSGNHSGAICNNGELYMWGCNESGQLGLGDLNSHDMPQKVDLESTIISGSCGKFHTIVLTKNYDVYGCGSNLYGSRVVPPGNNLECFPLGNTIGIRK